MSQNAQVKPELFDIFGGRIINLIDEQKSAGYHPFKFEERNLVIEIYLHLLSAGSFTTKSGHYVVGEAGEYVETKKMVFMK